MGTVGHCHELDLHGCKPSRECTGKMLGDNADEPLNGAEHNAVDHNGAMLCAVRTGVLKLKPFGKLHIELYGAALPGSAEAVRNMEIELRAVECAVTLIDDVLLAELGDSFLEGLGRAVPGLDLADMILGHGGELDLIFEAEGRIYLVEQTDDILYLVLHLIPSHEDMSIILSKAADAEESVQCT